MHWIIKRIAQAIFTFLSVITVSFALIRFMPGGPLDFVRAQLMRQMSGSGSVQMDRVNRLVEIYTNIDPDKPMWAQYLDYMTRVLQGDLGKSMWFNQPVLEVLGDAVPWTIFLMSVSLFITFSIGIVLGAIMAYNEGSRFDYSVTSLVIWLNGIPYYVAALLMLYFLSFQYDLFPTNGRVGRVEAGWHLDYFVSVLYHAALPIASVVITGFGGWALSMRGNSIQTLGEDYLRVARLRGLNPNTIALRYVARNAILPMYTGLMISIGFLFGGSVILEQVFAYPGVGFYLVRAVNARDYPLMMGGFLIITMAVVVGIFIADLTYGLIDPRIRSNEGGGD
jgi:peptide/nickel transport system permease protein